MCKIRIALLGSGFVGRSASGTALVALKLIEGLLAKPEIEISILVKNETEQKWVKQHSILNRCETILLPQVSGNLVKSFRQFIKFSLTNRKSEFDLLHFTVARFYPFFWLFPAKNFSCTFHAAGDITAPRDRFIFSRSVYNLNAKLFWRKLQAIYAVSDFAANEISVSYRIPINKISKIYIGTDHLWSLKEKSIKEFSNSTTSILILGRFQEYKNVHSILSAILLDNHNKLKKYRIYLVGSSQKNFDNLVDPLINRYSKENLVHFEFLPSENLSFLYSNSDLVIFPSVNEGFGLPAFEAFGAGASILIHRSTPAAKILGNFSGVQVANLVDEEEILPNILNSLNYSNKEVDFRRAFLSSNKMTWEAMAEEYYNSFLELVQVK